MEGREIKIRLLQMQKTQRWLLDKLRGYGFGKLQESRLSDILNDRCTLSYTKDVLEASKQILDKENKKTA